MLLKETLLSSVITIYYKVFIHQYKGDNCALIIDVLIKIFFINFTCLPFNTSAQDFSSKDIKTALKYFQTFINIHAPAMLYNTQMG